MTRGHYRRSHASRPIPACRSSRCKQRNEDVAGRWFGERIPGEWKMLEESAPHAQGNASIAVWKLTVPAEGETVPTYWVRVRS